MKMNQRLKARNEKTNPCVMLSVILAVMFVISGILLLLLAWGLYQMDLSEAVVKIGVVAIYIIACFTGGFLLGRWIQDKKYLWGLLTGALYFVLLFVVSILLKKGMGEVLMEEPMRVLTTFALCTVSAMAGGMFS
jgi:putative membrane protein (TIGR04086 family)